MADPRFALSASGRFQLFYSVDFKPGDVEILDVQLLDAVPGVQIQSKLQHHKLEISFSGISDQLTFTFACIEGGILLQEAFEKLNKDQADSFVASFSKLYEPFYNSIVQFDKNLPWQQIMNLIRLLKETYWNERSNLQTVLALIHLKKMCILSGSEVQNLIPELTQAIEDFEGRIPDQQFRACKQLKSSLDQLQPCIVQTHHIAPAQFQNQNSNPFGEEEEMDSDAPFRGVPNPAQAAMPANQLNPFGVSPAVYLGTPPNPSPDYPFQPLPSQPWFNPGSTNDNPFQDQTAGQPPAPPANPQNDTFNPFLDSDEESPPQPTTAAYPPGPMPPIGQLPPHPQPTPTPGYPGQFATPTPAPAHTPPARQPQPQPQQQPVRPAAHTQAAPTLIARNPVRQSAHVFWTQELQTETDQRRPVFFAVAQLVPQLNRAAAEGVPADAQLLHNLLRQAVAQRVDLFQLLHMFHQYEPLCKQAQEQGFDGEFLNSNARVQRMLCAALPSVLAQVGAPANVLLDPSWLLAEFQTDQTEDQAVERILPFVADALLHKASDQFKIFIGSQEKLVHDMLASFKDYNKQVINDNTNSESIHRCTSILLFKFLAAVPQARLNQWYQTNSAFKKDKIKVWREIAKQVTDLYEGETASEYERQPEVQIQIFSSLLDFYKQCNPDKPKEIFEEICRRIDKVHPNRRFEYFVRCFTSGIDKLESNGADSLKKCYIKFLGEQSLEELIGSVLKSPDFSRLPKEWSLEIKTALDTLYSAHQQENDFIKDLLVKGTLSKFFLVDQATRQLRETYHKFREEWNQFVLEFVDIMAIEYEIKIQDYRYFSENSSQKDREFVSKILSYKFGEESNLPIENKLQDWAELYRDYDRYLSQQTSVEMVLNEMGSQSDDIKNMKEQKGKLKYTYSARKFEKDFPRISQLVLFRDIPELKLRLIQQCKPTNNLKTNNELIEKAMQELGRSLSAVQNRVNLDEYRKFKDLLAIEPRLLIDLLVKVCAIEEPETVLNMLAVLGAMQADLNQEKQNYQQLCQLLENKFGLQTASNPWHLLEQFKSNNSELMTKEQLMQLGSAAATYIYNRARKNSGVRVLEACAFIFEHLNVQDEKQWKNFSRNLKNSDNNQLPENVLQLLRKGVHEFTEAAKNSGDLFSFFNELLKNQSVVTELTALEPHKDVILKLFRPPAESIEFDINEVFNNRTEVLFEKDQIQNTYKAWLASYRVAQSEAFKPESYEKVKRDSSKTGESLDALCSRLQKLNYQSVQERNEENFDKKLIALNHIIQNIIESLNSFDEYGYLLSKENLASAHAVVRFLDKNPKLVVVSIKQAQKAQQDGELADLQRLKQELSHKVKSLEDRILDLSKSPASWVLGLRAHQRELLTSYIREQDPIKKQLMEELDSELVSILQFASGVMSDASKTLANFKSANSDLLSEKNLEKLDSFELLSRLSQLSQSTTTQDIRTRGAKIKYGSYENDNKYLSLLVYAVRNNQTLREMQACQFLFANQMTTSGEVKSFLTYAISAQKRFYIMDIDLLLPYVRRDLISCACKMHQDLSKSAEGRINPEVMLFIGHGDKFKVKEELRKYPEVFSAIAQEKLRYNKGLIDEDRFIPEFRESLRVTVVSSRTAGLGKSHYIETKLTKENFLVELMLSGEVNLESLSRRFSIIHKGMKQPANSTVKAVLATKVDMMERFQDNSWMVDQLLFQMIILKCVPYKRGFLNLNSIQHHYIEIGNNYKELLFQLPFIKFLIGGHQENSHRKHEIQTIKIDSSLKFKAVVQAKFIVIANALYAHQQNTFQKLSLRTTDEWSQILEMFKHGAPKVTDIYANSLNVNNLKNEVMSERLKTAFLQQIEGLSPDAQPRLENGSMSQLVAFVHVLFHQITMMDSNYQLNLQQAEWAAAQADPRVLEQLNLTAKSRGDLMDLICKLSCKFVWSNSRALREESSSMKQLDKEMKSVDQQNNTLDEKLKTFDLQMAAVLKGYRDKLQGFKTWSKPDKFSVIFSEGAMKVFYKQINDIPQSLRDIITRTLHQQLVEHSGIKDTMQKESYFLTQLTEAFNITFTEEFCRFVGADPKSTDETKVKYYLAKAKGFQGKGFDFNEDNFLKVLLIRQKVQVHQPVVIIGATGCGKTYLVTFLVEMLLREKICTLTLHSGTTESDISELMIEAFDACLIDKNKQVWVMFDEFNTSPLQSLIQEFVIARKCNFCPKIREKLNGKPLPPNIVFVLICNPLRVKKSDTNVGLIHENSSTAFTHRVYPIPDALLNYAWDFGQLTPEVERDYIKSALSRKNNSSAASSEIDEADSILLTDCVCKCHSFLRDKEGENSVSLRDVQRVKDIYKYLKRFLSPLNLENHKASVFVCTVYLNYFLRIGDMKLRDDLNAELIALCKASPNGMAVFGNLLTRDLDFNKLFKRVADDILNEINSSIDLAKRQIIRNTALRETVFALVVSVLTRTPIMICGKPGSSKTLSTTVVKEFLDKRPQDRIDAKLFESQPRVIFKLFNGSIITRSNDVAEFYKRCQDIYDQKNAGVEGGQPPKAEVVFLFDEMGLAEIGYDNPLKVLHPLLESEKRKIGFVGISNWKLDLSKMSRALFVARPDPSALDLEEMVTNSDLGVDLVIPSIGKYLAQSYLEFIANEFLGQATSQNQKDGEEVPNKQLENSYNRYSHPNFFGLRDFYHLIKYMRRNIEKLGSARNSAASLIKFIFNGIQRNFSGKCSIYWTKSSVGQLQRGGLYASCRIILEILCNKLKKDESCQPYFRECPIEPLSSSYNLRVIRLISQNLVDHIKNGFNSANSSVQEGSRHLMIFYENPTILTSVKLKLSQFFFDCGYSSRDITDFNGIADSEDLGKKVQMLPTILKQKHVLFLQDTEELYSCLYEVLNQYYGQSQERKCNIHTDNGAKSEEVTVHEDFRIVIFMNRVDDKVKDFKNKHPPPFLNRCEKHLVLYDDIIDPEQQERKSQLETELNKFRQTEGGNKQILIHGYSQEVLYSLVLGDEEFKSLQFKATNIDDYIRGLLDKDSGMATSLVNRRERPQDLARERLEAIKKLKQQMHTLFSREMFLEMMIAQQNADLSSMAQTFNDHHPYSSLATYFEAFFLKGAKDARVKTFFGKNTLLYTFSSSWEVKQIAESKDFKHGVSVKSWMDFKKDTNRWPEQLMGFLKYEIPQEKALLVITFDSRREWTIIPKLREAIDKLARNQSKHIVLIAHYTQEDIAEPSKEVETSITFSSGNWNLLTIDNLRDSDYKWFTDSLKSKPEAVILAALNAPLERKDRDQSSRSAGGNEIIYKLEQNMLEKLRKVFRLQPNVSNEEFFLHTTNFFALLLQLVKKNRAQGPKDQPEFYTLVQAKRKLKLQDQDQSHFELTMQCIKEIVDQEVTGVLNKELDQLEKLLQNETNKVLQSAKFGGSVQAKSLENWLNKASKILTAQIQTQGWTHEGDMNAKLDEGRFEAPFVHIDVEKRTTLTKDVEKIRQANERLCADLGTAGAKTRNQAHKREICKKLAEEFKQLKAAIGLQKARTETHAKLTEEDRLIYSFELLNTYLQKTNQRLPTDSQTRFLAAMLDVFIKKVNPTNTESKVLELNSFENMAVLLIWLWEVYSPDIVLLPEPLAEDKLAALIQEFEEGLFINSSVSIIQNLRSPVAKMTSRDDLSKVVEIFENQIKIAENLKKIERFKPEIAIVQTNIHIARYVQAFRHDAEVERFCKKMIGSHQRLPNAEINEEIVSTTEFTLKGLEFILEIYRKERNVEVEGILDYSFKSLKHFILLFERQDKKEVAFRLYKDYLEITGKAKERKHLQAFTDIHSKVNFVQDKNVPLDELIANEQSKLGQDQLNISVPVLYVADEPGNAPQPKRLSEQEMYEQKRKLNSAKLKSEQNCIEEKAFKEGRPSAQNLFEKTMKELSRILTVERDTDAQPKWRTAASAYYFATTFLRVDTRPESKVNSPPPLADVQAIDSLIAQGLQGTNMPAAVVLFREMIKNYQADERLFRNHGLRQLPEFLLSIFKNPDLRRMTDLISRQRTPELNAFEDSLRNPAQNQAAAESLTNKQVEKAAIFARMEIFDHFENAESLLSFSYNPEGDSESHVHRVIWAYFHWKAKDKISISTEVQEKYLLLAYTAILVGNSDQTQRDKISTRVNTLRRGLQELEDNAKDGANKLKNQIIDGETARHIPDSFDIELYESLAYPRFLKQLLTAIVTFCGSPHCSDSQKDQERVSNEIKTLLNELSLPSKLQYIRLRINLQRLCETSIFKMMKSNDPKEEIAAIDRELQKILSLGDTTREFVATNLRDEIGRSASFRNGLLGLELLDDKSFIEAKSVSVFGRNWVPTRQHLLEYIANQEPPSLQSSNISFNADNSWWDMRAQAKFIAKLSEQAQVYALYSNLLLAIQQLCKAMKAHICQSVTGNEALKIKISEYVGEEVPDARAPPGSLPALKYNGKTPLQEEIQRTWIEFRARWKEFLALKTTTPEVFDLFMEDSRGVSLHIFANQDESDKMLQALLKADSVLAYFLIPPMDYIKNQRAKDREVKFSEADANKVLSLMRGITNELVYIHNWFVKTLHRLVFSDNPQEQHKRALRPIPFMSFKPKVLPRLQEMDFQNLIERCAEVTSDQPGKVKVIFKAYEELAYLWDQNSDMRLITPPGYKENNIFALRDSQPIDLRNLFIKKIYNNRKLNLQSNLMVFKNTRDEILSSIQRQTLEMGKIPEILNKLNSLCDDLDLDIDANEEMTLMELFGDSTKNIYGFPTFKRKQLIHYITCLGECQFKEDLEKKNKATRDKSVQQALEFCRLPEHKELLPKVSTTQVQMELSFWYYMQSTSLHNTNAWKFKKTMTDSGYFDHLPIYENPDRSENPVLKFLQAYYEKTSKLKQNQVYSLEPKNAVPEMTAIIEALLKYMSKEAPQSEKPHDRAPAEEFAVPEDGMMIMDD